MAIAKNTPTTEHGTINGVDTKALFTTIEAVKDQPQLAKFEFRARNRWIDGAHCRSTIRDFYGAGAEDVQRTRIFVFDSDEPQVLLGADRGANPVEFLLHALAGCLTASLVYHAAARGIRLESVESRFEGDLDLRGFLGLSPDIRNGFRQIRVTFRVKGDAPRETLEELVQLAQKRSPVYDMVTNPVPVEVRLAED